MMAPDEAFARDVPADLREDLLTRICEAMHDADHVHDDITIIERDWLNSLNVRAHGIVETGGVEYTFIAESGNNAGFVLDDWNGGRDFEPASRAVYALQPQAHVIASHIAEGRGPFLIQKWDHFLTRPAIRDIVASYTYDRHFAPGGQTETYWRARASAHLFDIVSAEEAAVTRQHLAEATRRLE